MKTIKWSFYYSLLICNSLFYYFLYNKLYSLNIFTSFIVVVLFVLMFIFTIDFIINIIKPILIKEGNLDKIKYMNKNYLVSQVLGYIPVPLDDRTVKRPSTKL
jgi:hypothetical protein